MISWLQRWTSPVDPDAYLAALNPRWSSELTGTIERITPLTATAASLEIRPSRGWQGHRAGQFVTLGVDVDGVRHHRCYSITSSPRRPDRRIEIAVQAVPGGVVSNHLVHHARPGDTVRMQPAGGDFTLPDQRPARLLLISGGSGITPLLGMLRTIVGDCAGAVRASDRGIDVVVLHHAPTAERAMFTSELTSLAASSPWLRVDVSLTRSGGARLDAASLDRRCPDWRDRDAFVCGPDPLLDFATDHWASSGRVERLHIERFTPSRSLRQGEAGAGRVRFDASGVDADSAGDETLLELAERVGLVPPTGCRMGVCHTCTTPVLSGCARDRRDGRVVDAGAHVQLCVSVPAGDLVLDL